MIKFIFVTPLLTSWLANVGEDRVSGITLSLDDAKRLFHCSLGLCLGCEEEEERLKRRRVSRRGAAPCSVIRRPPSAILFQYRQFTKPFLLLGQHLVVFYSKQPNVCSWKVPRERLSSHSACEGSRLSTGRRNVTAANDVC